MNFRLKDYLRLSKIEKKGFSILVVLILLVIAAKESLIYFNPLPDAIVLEADSLIEAFKQVKKERNFSTISKETKGSYKTDSLFPFNPNELSIAQWQTLGLTENQAKTILKYQAKGGNFRIKSDLAKMFSISAEMYESLAPYILLPESLSKETKPIEQNKAKKEFPKPIVSINQADSAAFTKLYGIGPYFAKKIIAYRNQLGGFHSIKQLNEIWGIEDSLIAELWEQLRIGPMNLKQLNINKLSAKELKEHPYINWNLANSIEQMRKQHGPYQSIEEIKRSVLVNDSIYSKLEPYLSIE